MKKFIIICLTIFFIIFPISIAKSQMVHQREFDRDLQRLLVLQSKLKGCDDPVDKFFYSDLMVHYLEDMIRRMKELNIIYYEPALLTALGKKIPPYKSMTTHSLTPMEVPKPFFHLPNGKE